MKLLLCLCLMLGGAALAGADKGMSAIQMPMIREFKVPSADTSTYTTEYHAPTISWTYCVQYETFNGSTTTLHGYGPCLIELIGWSDGSVSWKRKE